VTLDLESEAVRPTGGVASEGVLNQLGRPKMDRLTVLIREAGQNSLDAKARESPTVEVSIVFREFTAGQLQVLRREVFAQVPGHLPLAASLAGDASGGYRQGPRVLLISDRGTVGLGGPTRADAPDDADGRDFVDLLRNVGQPPGRLEAGGTYGYGKAALFLASEARTILVYTRCRNAGQYQTRFMAAGLGEGYSDPAGRFTGRHWWGRQSADLVEPILGDDADEIARSIGLPGFDSEERGTTIAILSPLLDNRTAIRAANHIIEAILFHFWPKMLPDRGGVSAMRFRVCVDGNDIPVPSPDAFPPLQGFAAAWRGLRDIPDANAISLRVLDIEALRPVAHLGRLALVKFDAQRRHHLDPENPVDDAWPIGDASHHIALMRAPELVVEYLDGPPLASSAIEYAGVFKVAPEVEKAFSDAEPPTHDDWQPENLQDQTHKRFVRRARRRILELVAEFVGPAEVASYAAVGGSLASFADQLGSLLVGADGTGGRVPRDHRTRERDVSREYGTRPRAVVETAASGALEVLDGVPAFVLGFSISSATGSKGSMVRANPVVLLDGGTPEVEPPAGSDKPQVIGWRSADGSLVPTKDLWVPRTADGSWSVVVSIPLDSVVGVSLDAEVVP
jgi:hypothetical protein